MAETLILVSWFSTALVAVAGTVSLYNLWLTRKLRMRWERRIEALPPSATQLGRAVHYAALAQLGFDVDLLERAITDLEFLHDKTCTSCPACQVTIPQLQRAVTMLQSISIDGLPKNMEDYGDGC